MQSLGVVIIGAQNVNGVTAAVFNLSDLHSYRVISLACQLVTDATVASRFVLLSCVQAGVRLWDFGESTAVTASSTRLVTVSNSSRASVVASTRLYCGAGDLWIPENSQASLVLDNGVVGDAVSDIRLVAEKFVR